MINIYMKNIIKNFLGFWGYEVRNLSKVKKYDELKKWQFIRTFDIKNIIDVGASEGQFIKLMIQFFPNAHIYAFEPIEDCYKKLHAKFLSYENIHLYNTALADQEGESSFSLSSATPSSSLLKMSNLHKKLFPHTASTREQTVNVMKLDNVLDVNDFNGMTLMKIDVQGAEDKVFRGGQNILDKVSMVISEVSYTRLYVDQPLFDDINKALSDKGFIYIGNLEQFYTPVTKAPLFADAIFVRKEVHDQLYS